MVGAAAGGDRGLLQRRAAPASSCACRGSARRCPRPPATQRAVSVATPDRRCEEVERGPLGGEDRARRRPVTRSTSPPSRHTPSAASGSTSSAGSSWRNVCLGRLEPEHHARRLLGDRRRARASRRARWRRSSRRRRRRPQPAHGRRARRSSAVSTIAGEDTGRRTSGGTGCYLAARRGRPSHRGRKSHQHRGGSMRSRILRGACAAAAAVAWPAGGRWPPAVRRRPSRPTGRRAQVAAGLGTPDVVRVRRRQRVRGRRRQQPQSGPPERRRLRCSRAAAPPSWPGSPDFVAGLAWRKGTLYVSGGTYRHRPEVSSWPGAAGTAPRSAKRKVLYTAPKKFTGFNGIGFGANGRLYVGVSLSQTGDHGPRRRPTATTSCRSTARARTSRSSPPASASRGRWRSRPVRARRS